MLTKGAIAGAIAGAIGKTKGTRAGASNESVGSVGGGVGALGDTFGAGVVGDRVGGLVCGVGGPHPVGSRTKTLAVHWASKPFVLLTSNITVCPPGPKQAGSSGISRKPSNSLLEVPAVQTYPVLPPFTSAALKHA